MVPRDRKWRVTANVKNCAVVVVLTKIKVNPIHFSWKWEEDELAIVDQGTYLGVEILKYYSWDTHIANKIGKGKPHRRDGCDPNRLAPRHQD